MRAIVAIFFLSSALFSATGGQAWAQSSAAPAEKAAPGAAAQSDQTGKPGGNLSEKLDNANGVIKPSENIDPGMEKAAPQTGATRVVPPPTGPKDAQPK